MKKCWLVIAGIGGLSANLAWAAGMQAQQAFPFQFKPVAGKQIAVSKTGNKVMAQLPNGKKQLLATLEDDNANASGTEIAVAQVGDFNFDGTQDVAIQDGNGYGGVNIFYRLFLVDKTGGQLKEFAEAISNPELDVKRKTLTVAERSGPRWFATEYRSQNGKLYPAMKSEMLALGDGAVNYLTFTNAAGKVTGHKLVNDEGQGNSADQADATATVQVAKAPLFDKPNAASKTKMYLVKGDTVTLLDWKAKSTDSAGLDGWYLIRYKGSKVIEKWLESSALNKG